MKSHLRVILSVLASAGAVVSAASLRSEPPVESKIAAASATVPGQVIEILPGRAGRPSEHDVMESAFCAKCHPAIYAEHEQSTHGRAYTDPEVRLATGRFAHKDCIICHTPRPIFETGIGQNPRRRHHGLSEGNTCMTCHWKPNYDYDAFSGGGQCREAFHEDVGTVEACASCHRNHGTPYQWEDAPAGKGSGRTCMDCHMPLVERAVAVGGPVREVYSHVFPGSRSESQVKRAYRYSARIEDNEAVVTITNRGTGHNFPTELKQRSVESLVIVRDMTGAEVARSRMIFRDPYKRPYGLTLPVNTQIPSGESRTHRVPIGIESGTVEYKLFFKLYYPIEDYHSDLSRVLESRALPFDGITPSEKPVETEVEIVPVSPENIPPEIASPANLVDYARPPIGTVQIDVPSGETPEDIQRLIGLFQFPVPEGNKRARKRLVEIGLPAVPALIDALGSWDNKTYNQAMSVLEMLDRESEPAILSALDDERLYVRLHAQVLVARLRWRKPYVVEALGRAMIAEHALLRAGAASAAGELGCTQLGDRLLELLEDKDPDVVRASAMALSAIGRTDATPAIEAALERAHYFETRRDIALALGRLGSIAGIPHLLTGLEHTDDLIRESAFEAFFAATGVHLGFDPLAPRPDRLEALSDLQSYWAESGTPEQLLPRDPEADPAAEAHAWKLVQKLGGSDYLVPSKQDAHIEQELITMGKYAVPALVRGLKYPPGFSVKRVAICRALGRIGDRRAAPVLGSTLRDPVLGVAAWAAWALENSGDAANLPAIRRYEQRLRRAIATDRVPETFGLPERALAQAARTRLLLGDPSARHTLASLLLATDEYTRELSFGALKSKYGEDRGYEPSGDETARRLAARRWMK